MALVNKDNSFEESLKKAYIKKIDKSPSPAPLNKNRYEGVEQYFGMMEGRVGTMEEIDKLISEGRSEREDWRFE